MTANTPPVDSQNHWRGRFNAWFFTAFDRYINYATGPNKRAALAGIGPSPVVEIGSGIGANLAYLTPGSRLIAVEPNQAMHAGLSRRADEAGIELQILATPASAIPLPDESVDDVICSLVLCTVDDPAATMTEVRRILSPGGRFRFVEHVVAPSPGPRRLIQRILRRPWSWVFEGCQLDRDTTSLLHEAGFTSVEVSRRKPRLSVFWMVNTQIHGIATR